MSMPVHRTLLAPSVQVRMFVGATDKYGLGACDLAGEAGHAELARVLRLFSKRDASRDVSVSGAVRTSAPGELHKHIFISSV